MEQQTVFAGVTGLRDRRPHLCPLSAGGAPGKVDDRGAGRGPLTCRHAQRPLRAGSPLQPGLEGPGGRKPPLPGALPAFAADTTMPPKLVEPTAREFPPRCGLYINMKANNPSGILKKTFREFPGYPHTLALRTLRFGCLMPLECRRMSQESSNPD